MACTLLIAAPVRAENPLSAINWLSASVAPASPGNGTRQGLAPLNEPPIAKGGALPETIATTPLGAPDPDASGLISPQISGLPANLWGPGLSEDIARAITRDRMSSLPALRQLFLTLLLAEAHPPFDANGQGLLLQARVDKLMQLGALEQAAALLEVAGAETPELFRRAFDIALLTGHENRACRKMTELPGLAPTIQTRVFCLARGGQWAAAATVLAGARALGQIPPGQADLLTRFLDPDLFDTQLMPPPNPITPLSWKLYDAVGDTLPTANLPAAFAYADLSQEAGWKAQIEAAERLTRAGTVAPNLILGLYTAYSPAASGGLWDRVSAFQNFDAAVQSGDDARILASLPQAWEEISKAQLEVPFAFLYGRAISTLETSDPDTAALAYRIALLSPVMETVARRPDARSDADEFLANIALGRLAIAPAQDRMAVAIAQAFSVPEVSWQIRDLLANKRLGEALLAANEEIARGVDGNMTSISQGLSALRMVGLEGVARRAALELLILDRRG